MSRMLSFTVNTFPNFCGIRISLMFGEDTDKHIVTLGYIKSRRVSIKVYNHHSNRIRPLSRNTSQNNKNKVIKTPSG